MSNDSEQKANQFEQEPPGPVDAERDGDLAVLRVEINQAYRALRSSGASDFEARTILKSYIDDTIEDDLC